MHSYCPQCGVMDTCDEDRCCPTCGADMILEEVLALIRAEERERIAGEWDAISDDMKAGNRRAHPFIACVVAAAIRKGASNV